MAATVIIYVGKAALIKLIPLITEEMKLFWGFDDELNKLRESLDEIDGVVKDNIEENPTTKVAVARWLTKLKDGAYDAEDLIDELAYESLRQQVERQNEKVYSFSPFLKVIDFVGQAVLRLRMAHKLKKVTQSLQNIRSEARKFKFIQLNMGNMIPPHSSITSSVLDNPVVGREADVSKIVHLFTRRYDQQVLTVIPIVGIGGLGKTALAKLVFKEAKERELFDKTIWVCVSDNFETRRILKEMLEGVGDNTVGLTNVDAIIDHLKEKLEGKKFLLVLDDVWNEEPEKWNNLRSHLLAVCRNNGNAVVLTTRKDGVASLVETSSLYRHTLDSLTENECWSIIKQKVVGDGVPSIPSALEAIGKEIAKKCRGVPLVAKVLGGTMCLNMDRRVRLSIRNSSVFNTLGNKDSILPILRLSFDRLPSYLKPCFAYCSIFPKDTFIEKKQLIQLWMAEGLLEPSSDHDVGNKYFKDLLENSFFQDVERDKFDNVTRCRMHELMHVLALSISNSETLIMETCSVGDFSRVRHLNLIGGQPVPIFPKDGAKKLRSLFITDAEFHESWMLKSLRTLKLEGSNLEKLPSSIGKLKHLRYLDVSLANIKAFPESIIKLYNLQTLRLTGCRRCEEIPRLGHLPRLKILEIDSMEKVRCIGNEFYGVDGQSTNIEWSLFPALKVLSLKQMQSLVEWMAPAVDEGGNAVTVFPCLEELCIMSCRQLRRIPIADRLLHVKLEIEDCDELSY